MQQEETDLAAFIEASKTKGASDDFLVTLLGRNGWAADDVYGALGDYWERVSGLAVPKRRAASESSRDAFLYLLAFATLATWSGALGSILFHLIDHWLPDPVALATYDNFRLAVTWQMASLVVSFPIFILVMKLILGEAQKQPGRLQSGVRKWLTYLALLLTAGGMISDLIWFLDSFLRGELTSRFVLKSIVVLLICGTIFVFYLGSMRWDRHTDVGSARRRSLRFGLGVTAAVGVTFCVGLGTAGTPHQQHRIEADTTRVQALQKIVTAISLRYQQSRLSGGQIELPASLEELVRSNAVSQADIRDPETRAPYEYRIRQKNEYELCATFAGAAEEGSYASGEGWRHGEGLTCFTRGAWGTGALR